MHTTWLAINQILGKEDLQPYWTFRDEIAMIDGTAIKGRIIIPAVLQDKVLKQVHMNHLGTKKTRLLPYESIYWMAMNAGIEEMVKKCPSSLAFQTT